MHGHVHVFGMEKEAGVLRENLSKRQENKNLFICVADVLPKCINVSLHIVVSLIVNAISYFHNCLVPCDANEQQSPSGAISMKIYIDNFQAQ